MQWQTIGEISLNVTVFIYCFWFIPQLVLTFRRKSIAALSFNMHLILLLSYISDLVYGFGMKLPLQYRLVTILGLSMMTIEHVQFWLYNYWSKSQRAMLYGITTALICLLSMSVYAGAFAHYTESFYNAVGVFSIFCWILFTWPQLYKNFANQSVVGVSQASIGLSLVTGSGDLLAAVALNWPWPSRYGFVLALIPRILLFCQFFKYRPHVEIAHAV